MYLWLLSQLGFQFLFHCGCTDVFFLSQLVFPILFFCGCTDVLLHSWFSIFCSFVDVMMASSQAGVPNLVSLWMYLWHLSQLVFQFQLPCQLGFQFLFHCGRTDSFFPSCCSKLCSFVDVLVASFPVAVPILVLSQLEFQFLFLSGYTDGFFPNWFSKSGTLVNRLMASFPIGNQNIAPRGCNDGLFNS